MSKIAFFGMAALVLSVQAHAELKVCDVKKVVKAEDGTETVTSCKLTLDSGDSSQTSAPGSIKRDPKLYLGTAKNNCDLPSPKAFGMYDQGKQSDADTKGLFDYLNPEFSKHGDLGIDPARVSYSKWYAGGDGVALINLYEFFDSSNQSLGMMIYPLLGAPDLRFEGCFVK